MTTLSELADSVVFSRDEAVRSADSAVRSRDEAVEVSRTFDWLILFTLFFVVLGGYHIHYMLTGGDWDFWSDWKDRRLWVTVAPIVSITFPAAVQACLWWRYRLPFGAVFCILGLLLGEWINRYLSFWGWTYFPVNFCFPSNLMPGAIVLDAILMLTGSMTVTAVIGGLAWGLLFYPGNWPIIAPLHVPVQYNGMMMTLADLQGYHYVRTGTPDSIRMVEKGTLKTFSKDVAPVSAFFSGFVSVLIYYLWHFFGKWFGSTAFITPDQSEDSQKKSARGYTSSFNVELLDIQYDTTHDQQPSQLYFPPEEKVQADKDFEEVQELAGRSSRILDVLLTGHVATDETITVTAIIKCIGSPQIGQWSKDFMLDSTLGPVTVRIDLRGFMLQSTPSVVLEVPADKDSEPAAFILKVLEEDERWIELSLYQSRELLTYITISNFNTSDRSNLINRQYDIRPNKAVDLELRIDPDWKVEALNSNLSDVDFGKIVAPEENSFHIFNKRLAKLYNSSSSAGLAEYDLKVLGSEIAECLPKRLLDHFINSQPKTVILRHEVTNWFPIELALLKMNGIEYFLGDQVVICRWLRGIENNLSSKTKNIRRVAVIGGEVQTEGLAKSEYGIFTQLCSSADYFDTAEMVLEQVLGAKTFELIHYIGHCEKDPDSNLPSLKFKQGRSLLLSDIGSIEENSRFGRISPIVSINGCITIEPTNLIFGNDSFPRRFLKNKAIMFIGTLWPIEECVAHEFSSTFYRMIQTGMSVGEAFLKTKNELISATMDADHKPLSDDTKAWRRISVRSYCIFAHPEMIVSFHKLA